MTKEETDISLSYKFPKRERLNSKKLIDALFAKGASFHIYPFMIKYLQDDSPHSQCHQVLVSVSKKKFKRAVDRNRIKRLVKEAYRLQKNTSLSPDQEGKHWLLGLVYVGKKIHSYQMIEKKLIAALQRLEKEKSKI